jgi:hypothetical protein
MLVMARRRAAAVWHTLCDHIACQDQMVVLVGEMNLFQQMLQLFFTAVYIANKDQSIPPLREMLLVHVLDLDHVLEVWAHIAPITHGRCLIHQTYFLLVCRVPWSKVGPPAYKEEKCEGEGSEEGALDPPRKSIDSVLPLCRDQKVVVVAVEAVFLIGHVELIAVVRYEVDERSVNFGRMRIIAVVRHRSGRLEKRDAGSTGIPLIAWGDVLEVQEYQNKLRQAK